MKTTLLIPVIHLFFVIILEAQLPSPIIIDHTSVGKFSEISEEKIQKEIPIRVMFRHASVGTTINNGLDCISGSRKSPKECTVFPIGKYDRSNWSFQPRGNSGWYGKVDDFVAEVDKQADNFDVFSFKYCYLEGLDGILEPCGSTFDPAKVQKAWDYLRDGYETLESKYTDKVFIWWTIPLTQVGMKCTDSLNSRIREYCRNNNKILFDIADIESYDTLGNHQIGSSGYEIAFKNYCGEQNPGAQSCHPNWTGSIMLGKAFWFMMAEVTKYYDFTGINEFNRINEYPYIEGNFTINPSIRLNLKNAADISIIVYDLLGNKLFENNAFMKDGLQSIPLNIKSGCGLYFIQVNTGNSLNYLKCAVGN